MDKDDVRLKNLMDIRDVNARKTPEERKACASVAGKASGAAKRKKNAMRAALEMIMTAKATDEVASQIREQLPSLADTDIDGYVEAAATLRKFAREDSKTTVKLIEIMGGSLAPDQDQDKRNITIIVGNPKDQEAIDNI